MPETKAQPEIHVSELHALHHEARRVADLARLTLITLEAMRATTNVVDDADERGGIVETLQESADEHAANAARAAKDLECAIQTLINKCEAAS